jgi:hypothetical protein
MRRNNSLRIVALALVIAGSFIVLRSSGNSKSTTDSKEPKEVCCKCKKPQGSSQQGDMIWENLSRQFFS